MSNLGSIKSEARSVASSVHASQEVKTLAEIVARLCDECEQIERRAKDAQKRSKQN